MLGEHDRRRTVCIMCLLYDDKGGYVAHFLVVQQRSDKKISLEEAWGTVLFRVVKDVLDYANGDHFKNKALE